MIANVMCHIRMDNCKVRKEIRIIQSVEGGKNNRRGNLESFKFCLY